MSTRGFTRLGIALACIVLIIFCSQRPVMAGAEQLDRNFVEVYCNGKSYTYYDHLIQPTNHLVAQQIFTRKINRSPSEKIKTVTNLVVKGISEQKALTYLYPKIEQFVDQVYERTYKPSVDARLCFDTDKSPVFTIYSDKNGMQIDKRELYSKIFRAWQQNYRASVEISPRQFLAGFTAAKAKLQTFKRGEFSTDYASSAPGRKHNVELAAKKINGSRIGAGERFSFNKVVGKRTQENGFLPSKIIVGGDYVDGVGGGVCQVSTTLYNALLLSDVQVESARGHSLAPSYVAPSFDAMVNSGSSDLVFYNQTGAALYLMAKCDGKRITITLFGEKNRYKIDRQSVITCRGEVPSDKIIVDCEGRYVSEQMQSGEQIRVRGARAGFSSEGYLYYYEDGVLTSKKAIRRDKYLPVRGIIAKKP